MVMFGFGIQQQKDVMKSYHLRVFKSGGIAKGHAPGVHALVVTFVQSFKKEI